MMWAEKYRPSTILEMMGNEEIRASLVEWLGKWKKGTKPILLVGKPGVGKTTLAILLAKQFGYDLISLNASDARNKQKIIQTLEPILGSSSILGKPMIFVDEVDGIHGRSDFGGVVALVKILKEPTVPIILAANDASSSKMKTIKKAAKVVMLRPIPPRLLRIYLENIFKKEGTKLGVGSILKLVVDSRGDLRSLLNTAQSLVTGFEPPTEKSFETLNVEDAVNAFFKAKSFEEASVIMYSLSINPREKINAFYSSIISTKLSKDDMNRMLQVLSEADMIYGKIIRTQEWRLLRYLDSILLGLYKENIPVRYSQFNLPWPLVNRLRWDGKTIKNLAKLLGKKMHISVSDFSTFYFPYILKCIQNKALDLHLDESYNEIIKKEIELIK